MLLKEILDYAGGFFCLRTKEGVRMKKQIKIFLSATLIVAAVLGGCTGGGSSAPSSGDSGVTSSVVDTTSAPTMGEGAESSMTELQGEPSDLQSIRDSQQRITVYTIDTSNMTTVPVTAIVDTSDGLDYMDVLKACSLNFADQKAEVEYNSAEVTGSSLAIDFKAVTTDEPFGKGTGAFEPVILDGICKSIFDNFDNIKSVYVSIDGEAFVSKKVKLTLDKPYMTNE